MQEVKYTNEYHRPVVTPNDDDEKNNKKPTSNEISGVNKKKKTI
jgi:hypothetical protein